MAYLRKQAQENLQHHIHETIPELYEQCMTGMKHNLKQTLEIGETSSDPRTKLQARAVANDIYQAIMNLGTNGVVVSDTIKYIQGKKQEEEGEGSELKESKSEEPDYGDEEEIEEKQEKDTGELEKEEEKTTNDVF